MCLDDNPSETHNCRPNKRNPSSSRSHAVQNTMRCSSPLNCTRRRRSRLCPSRDIPGLKALALEPCLRGGTNVRFSLGCPTLKRTFCPFSVPLYGQAVLVASVLALPICRSLCSQGGRPMQHEGLRCQLPAHKRLPRESSTRQLWALRDHFKTAKENASRNLNCGPRPSRMAQHHWQESERFCRKWARWFQRVVHPTRVR